MINGSLQMYIVVVNKDSKVWSKDGEWKEDHKVMEQQNLTGGWEQREVEG
jgi:hypothetical protein